MLNKQRIKLVKFVIDINEKIFFERRLKNALEKLFEKPIEVIIDVGANKGQTIGFFKKINKNCMFFSFEPNRSLYQKLKAKYSTDEKVKVFNLGVTDSVGKKIFFQNILDYTSTFEALNFDSAYLDKKSKILGVKPEQVVEATYEVPTTTLSHFINSNVAQTVDILKLDVEGHEYACLKGLFLESLNVPVRFIQLERHNDDMYLNQQPFEAIEQLLSDHHFQCAARIRHGFGGIDEMIYKNTRLID